VCGGGGGGAPFKVGDGLTPPLKAGPRSCMDI